VSYPSGRWLNLGYTNQLVTQVSDDLGRAATYTYDGSSHLLTATDPNQSGQPNPKSTTYAWQSVSGCADQVMSSVTDPRQITFLSNTYSTNGTCRVTVQAVPSDTHGVTHNYTFAYTPAGQGNITQTDITDPNLNVTRTSYDATASRRRPMRTARPLPERSPTPWIPLPTGRAR
jgi:YD repeat-containing protein